MKRNLSLSILAILFCFQAMAQSGSSDAKTIITSANKKFMELFAGGTTGISGLYATDAELYPPNANVIKGNTNIEPYWKGGFGAGIKTVKLETVEADPAGDKIVETGKYTLFSADSKTIDSGKYIVIWKKEKGEWKLYRDIWNTSAAAK